MPSMAADSAGASLTGGENGCSSWCFYPSKRCANAISTSLSSMGTARRRATACPIPAYVRPIAFIAAAFGSP